MLTSFQPRFTIPNNVWANFKNYVNETYPRESFTHEQKEFIYKFLKQDNGQCSDLNKLWINYVADQLIDFAESWPASHEAISDQVERMQAITGKALLGLFNVQYMIRHEVPITSRTPEQNRLLEIHANIINYPLELTLDIGRFLNLPQGHFESIPQDPDAKVEDQHLFNQLHNFFLQSTLPQSQNETGDNISRTTSEDIMQQQHGEWDPYSSEDTFLRLCTYKVWCDKYEEENEWSTAKMLGQWLREAIQLYNKISYHWPHCKVKRFDDSQFQSIRHTAHNTWLSEIPHRAKVVGKTKKPTSNWVTDWCTYPVTEKRHEWESYFCSVILHAKNLFKLLGKHERFHEDGTTEASNGEPPAKRSRSNEEIADSMDENSLEVKIMRHISHEFRQVRHMMVQVDRNASIRHQELLREMLGHFKPVGNQLIHLNNGQHHIIRALDRNMNMAK